MENLTSLFDPKLSEDEDVCYESAEDQARATAKFDSLYQNGSTIDPQGACCHRLDKGERCLPPEPQLGNIEYKLKIVNPSQQRFEHLVTQMKWRLREGHGEAIYEIGVEDSGVLAGLQYLELEASILTLNQMALKLGAATQVLRNRRLENGLFISEVLVRKVPEHQHAIEVCVAVLGNVDVGKTTLIAVLTQGIKDNGRGGARLHVFRHLHEILSGRTSSISQEILGFNNDGRPVQHNNYNKLTSEEICELSTKLVRFLDLAGSRKYFHTTIKGLVGYSPHHIMLVVSSTSCAFEMTLEHLTIALALNVPFFIVITKIDILHEAHAVTNLEAILKMAGCRRVPILVKNYDDVYTAGTNQLKANTVPIFCVSLVKGTGLDLLLEFLYVLPPGIHSKEIERLQQKLPEFQIDEIIRVGDLDQVLCGLLAQGALIEGSEVQIGPHPDGSFTPVKIKSIHRNRVPCRMIRAGQSASICLDVSVDNLRAGMSLVSPIHGARGSMFFQAKVTLLYHPTGLCRGFQVTVHVGHIRQTAIITGIFASQCLHTNDVDSIMFKFVCQPEFVYVGQRILFRDGYAKGIGQITQVFP